MKSLGRILVFTKKLTPYYIAIVVASLFVTAAGIAVPFIIGQATDTAVAAVSGSLDSGDAVTKVLWLAGAFLAVDVLSTVISSIGGYYGDVMSQKMRSILSVRYYEKLLTLPQKYFDNELTGTITSRLNRSITEVTNFAKFFANNFFTTLLTVVAVLSISAMYSPLLTLLLAIVFPVYMWLTALTSRRWQRIEGKKNEQIDLAGGRFTEVIGQIRVVKSFVQELRELKHFTSRYDRTIDHTADQSYHWHWMDFARRAFMSLVFFGIYAIIFVSTVNGSFSVGDMVLLIQLVALARQPIGSMSYIVDTAQHAIAGSKDYFDVMALEPPRRPALADEVEQARADGSLPAALVEMSAFIHDDEERTDEPSGSVLSSRKSAVGLPLDDEERTDEPSGSVLSSRKSAVGLPLDDERTDEPSGSVLSSRKSAVGLPLDDEERTDEPSGPASTGSQDLGEVEKPASMAVSTGAPAALPVDYSTSSQREGFAVSFEDVTFGYDDDPDVLSDVSFDISRGERVAFVGESGGGKTTMTSLLLGLYAPRSGRIRVFDKDIAQMPISQLRDSIGVVFQDPALFSGTIRENISYARPDATEEQIIDAAKNANADQFIRGFHDGYDTLIGERGLKLSGGQKQRISVARAILKDAEILVLDEATSALDTRSERLVQAGLETLMENRTSLIIAHRLSTIANVDRIITLKDGRVDEVGTPAELAETDGIYATLLALQNAGTKKARSRLKKYDIAH
ncbi:ABC transporter ATP-binding protein [Actinomycetaceae bacterium L2_0104]